MKRKGSADAGCTRLRDRLELRSTEDTAPRHPGSVRDGRADPGTGQPGDVPQWSVLSLAFAISSKLIPAASPGLSPADAASCE